jgi:hypothetical protein
MKSFSPDIRASALRTNPAPILWDEKVVLQKVGHYFGTVDLIAHERTGHDAIVGNIRNNTERALPSHDLAIDEVPGVDPLDLWKPEFAPALLSADEYSAAKTVGASKTVNGERVPRFESLYSTQDVAESNRADRIHL